MAIEALPTEVLVKFKDRENTPSTTRFFLPSAGALFVNAHAIYLRALDIANLIAAMSDCTLMGVKTTFAGRDTAAVGAGEIERRGLFEFESFGGTPYVTAVPSFKYELLDQDRRSIAVRGSGVKTEVQAFIDAVLSGVPGPNNSATNAAGRDLVRCRDGYKFTTPSLLEKRGRSG